MEVGKETVADTTTMSSTRKSAAQATRKMRLAGHEAVAENAAVARTRAAIDLEVAAQRDTASMMETDETIDIATTTGDHEAVAEGDILTGEANANANATLVAKG